MQAVLEFQNLYNHYKSISQQASILDQKCYNFNEITQIQMFFDKPKIIYMGLAGT